MTQRFLDFMPFIFTWEGGYDNDPRDPGGETKFGIDKASHPDVDIKHLTKTDAEEIYWREYWLPLHCDALPEKVGEVIMNIGVNCGKKRAAEWLQSLVGAVVDGFLGPRTVLLTQSSGHSGAFLAKALLDRTEYHYRTRSADLRDAFLRGWLNRNDDLRDFLGL